MSGEKPTNQTSFSSLVVPVLPAIGLPTSLSDRRGAALDHAFHDRGDLVGRHRIHHLLAPVDQRRLGLALPALGGRAAAAFALVVLVDGVAVAILDAIDQRRLDAAAAVRKHRVGGDHAHDCRLARAERVGEIVRQIVIDAEALCILADQRHADVFGETHRHRVARLLDAVAQSRGPGILAGRVVFRAPDLAVAHLDFDRRVHHHRRRRVAVVERGRIDQRLERRTGLTVRLRRAVELALVERETAGHRQHAAGPGIHRHHAAGDFRNLPQAELALDRLAVLVLQHLGIDHVAGLEHLIDLCWRPSPRRSRHGSSPTSRLRA